MADGNILTDFGINLLEEEIDDVIFQTKEFLTDATFTGYVYKRQVHSSPGCNGCGL